MLSKVSIDKCPDIVTLKRPDESAQEFLALAPEQNLIRWYVELAIWRGANRRFVTEYIHCASLGSIGT
jgi:hypothetical protein